MFRAVLSSSALLVTVAASRWRGARIIWTAHNVRSHGALHPRIEAVFWSLLVRLIDGWIALAPTASGVEAWLPGLARKPLVQIPHGHYRPLFDDLPDQAQARERLGISPDAPVLAFVGRVASYKNIPELLRAFADWHATDAVLLIGGAPVDDEVAVDVARAAEGDARVLPLLRELSDHELAELVVAADVVVLPFEEITNSGSVLFALSLDRPVLTPAGTPITWMRDVVGARWVRFYERPLSTDDLEGAVEAARSSSDRRAPLSAFDWDDIARRTAQFFDRLLTDARVDAPADPEGDPEPGDVLRDERNGRDADE